MRNKLVHSLQLQELYSLHGIYKIKIDRLSLNLNGAHNSKINQKFTFSLIFSMFLFSNIFTNVDFGHFALEKSQKQFTHSCFLIHTFLYIKIAMIIKVSRLMDQMTLTYVSEF